MKASLYCFFIGIFFVAYAPAMKQQDMLVSGKKSRVNQDVVSTPVEQKQIKLYSWEDGDVKQYPYSISLQAAQFSTVLKKMIEVSEDNNTEEIVLHFSDKQVSFVAQLLQALPQLILIKQTEAQFVQKIIVFANKLSISFVDMVHLINYFDISIVFTALTRVRPLSLPKTQQEALLYNQNLIYIFTLAKQSTQTAFPGEIKVGSGALWQLFGRMLYPGCLQYPEIARMIDFITATRGGVFVRTVRSVGRTIGSWLGAPKAPVVQKEIESIVLDAYVQEHIELQYCLFKRIKVVGDARENASLENNIMSLAVHSQNEATTIALAIANNLVGEDTGFNNNMVQVLRINGSFVKNIPGNYILANSVAFHPSGGTIAAGYQDNRIKIWRIADGSLIKTLRGHRAEITSVAYSSDGSLIASGSQDARVIVWRVSDWSILNTFDRHSAEITTVAFSPDSSMLAIALQDGTVSIRRVVDGMLMHTLTGHSGAVNTIAWSIDGSMLVSGSEDTTIKIWRVSDGSLIKTLSGDGSAITSIAFHPHGSIIACGSDSDMVMLWSFPEGALQYSMSLKKPLIKAFSNNKAPLNAIAFTSNGNTLVVGSRHHAIELFEPCKTLREALAVLL